MARLSATLGVLVWLVGSPAAAGPDLEKLIVTDGPDAGRERGALVEALKLLPKHPWRVAVIDAEAARPEVRPSLRRLDAFTTTGGRVVYILRHSVLLRGAMAGSRFHVHALASVIWHEMAHIGGSNETQARKAEEDLWTRFIRDGQVDPVVALRYLSALKGRPHAGQLRDHQHAGRPEAAETERTRTRRDAKREDAMTMTDPVDLYRADGTFWTSASER